MTLGLYRSSVAAVRHRHESPKRWRHLWDGMYSCITFDNGERIAGGYDIAQQVHTADVTGAYGAITDEEAGRCYSAEGQLTKIELGSTWATGFAPDELATVSCLFRKDDATPASAEDAAPIHIYGSASISHYPYINGYFYSSILLDSTRKTITSLPVDVTNWHTLTVVRRGSGSTDYRIFQNGVLIHESTPDSVIGTTVTRILGTTGRGMGGWLNWFAAWNRPLSDSEVAGLAGNPQGFLTRRRIYGLAPQAGAPPAGADQPWRSCRIESGHQAHGLHHIEVGAV